MVNQLNYERMLAAGRPAAMNASCFQRQDLTICRNPLKDKHFPPPPPHDTSDAATGFRLPVILSAAKYLIPAGRVGDGLARDDGSPPPFVPFVPFVAIFWSFPTRQTQLMLAKIASFSIIIEWLE